jgi:hypothetical protein
MVSGADSEWSHMKMFEVAGRENSWMHVTCIIAVMIRCILVGLLTLSHPGVNREVSMT